MFHRPLFDMPDPFPSFCSTPPQPTPNSLLLTGIRRTPCATPPAGMLFGHLAESSLHTQFMWKIGQQRLPQPSVRGIPTAAELDDEVKGYDDVLMLLDISGAHLHSPLARVVFVTIDGKVYKLFKAMYGLRDAGASFDRKVLDVMNLMEVSLGKFSICVGYRKVMNTLVRLVRCGDDFSLSGRRSLCNAFRDDSGKPLLVRRQLWWDAMWRWAM